MSRPWLATRFSLLAVVVLGSWVLPLGADELPAGATGRLGSLRFRHDYEVRTLAVSPDGRLLVSNSVGTPFVHVWDTATGKELHRLAEPETAGLPRVFTPDGKTLAVGRHLWDLSTGKPLLELPGKFWAFTPNGKYVLCADEKATHLFSREEGRVLRSFAGVYPGLTPDGRTVVTAEYTGKAAEVKLRGWELATGKERYTLTGHFTYLLGDGRFLIRPDTAAIELWDAGTGERVQVLEAPGGLRHLGAIDVSGNGRRLAASNGRAVRVWDTASGKELHRFEVPHEHYSLTFTPDGTGLAAWMREGRLLLWDLTAGKLRHEQVRGWGSIFTPDGASLATIHGHAIRVWDAATGRERLPQPGLYHAGEYLVVSPDGRTIAAAEAYGNVVLWDRATGKEVRRFGRDSRQTRFRGSSLFTVAFSPDGQRLAWEEGSAVVVAEVATGKELRRFSLEQAPVTAVAFSPDGTRLAAAGMPQRLFTAQLPDKRTAAEVRVWDLGSGKEVQQAKGEASEHRLLGLAFRTADEVIALAAEHRGKSRVYNLVTGRDVCELPSVWVPNQPSAVSPDGRVLAWGSDGNAVYVWELATGKLLAELPQPRGVRTLAFAADGRLLAATNSEQTVTCWDVFTGKEVASVKGTDSQPTAVAFTPDSSGMVLALADTTLLLYPGPRQPGAAAQPRVEAARLWPALADESPKASAALANLADDPQAAVQLVKGRLQAIPREVPPEVRRLVPDLGSEQLTVREAASRQLEKLGRRAEAALRQALQDRPASDLACRIDCLLEEMERQPPAGEDLRGLRAVHLLEYLGTADAREVLRTLAEGAPGAWQTREAQAALLRLRGR